MEHPTQISENSQAIPKRFFTLLATCLFVLLAVEMAVGLEVRVGSDLPSSHVYIFADDPESSLPPAEIKFPLAIFIADLERAGQPKTSMRLSVLGDYQIIPEFKQPGGWAWLSPGDKGWEILQRYEEVRAESERNARTQEGKIEAYALKNWDSCVNFVCEIVESYSDASPYVLFNDRGMMKSSVKSRYLKDLLDGKIKSLDNLPPGLIKLHFSEVKPFLHGQLRDKLPDTGGPVPAKSE